VLLVGTLLLALPAYSQETSASETTGVQQDAEVAKELACALKELEQALAHLNSLQHHHQRPHLGAFDKGVQQVADYSPDQDTGSPTGDTHSGATTGMSAAGSVTPGTAPATSGQNGPSTTGARPSLGAFNKSWHHFHRWWDARHHHHHHVHHPFNPGERSRQVILARMHDNHSKTTEHSKSTTANGSKLPANGPAGLPTSGHVAKAPGGHSTATTTTVTTNGHSTTTTTTITTKLPPHHDLSHAAKKVTGHGHPAPAKHLAVAHHLGGHVGNHPTAAHHPAPHTVAQHPAPHTAAQHPAPHGKAPQGGKRK
jgi:hypothetical protein